MATLPWLARRAASHGVFWFYVLLVTLAECVTVTNAQIGLVFHLLILMALLVHAGYGADAAQRRLALALTLAPLIRVVSLALPLERIPQLSWYPLLAVPLLLSAAFIMRQTGIRWDDRGFQWRHMPLQLALSVGGLAIGTLEYLILRPAPVVAELSWARLALWAVILLLFTGFTEELLFRKIMHECALGVFGARAGLWYVAIMFGVLHTGYLSLLDVVFVGLVGALFAQIAQWSGSIFGVSLCHGTANITLFLLMPYLMTQAPQDTMFGFLALLFVGALAFVVVVGVLAWQATLRTSEITHNTALRNQPPRKQIAARLIND